MPATMRMLVAEIRDASAASARMVTCTCWDRLVALNFSSSTPTNTMFVVRSVLICLPLMVIRTETVSSPETFLASFGIRMARSTVSSLLGSVDRSMGSSWIELRPSSTVESPESVMALGS